jgi:hypothetical protein
MDLTKKVITKFMSGAVLGVRWNRDGSLLASCSDDSKIGSLNNNVSNMERVIASNFKKFISFFWIPGHESFVRT